MQPCKFKFVYSPSGTIDYEFHLKEEVNTKFITPNIISFSRPRSSWLYVLLNMPTEADEESEINQDDDCKTMRADNDLTGNFESTSTLSDVTTITRPQSSEAPEKILYIPPHKRSNFDTAHLRTSSEPSALLPKNASSAKDKGRYKSLNLTPKQRNPAMAKQTFTGAAYTPCPSPQLPGPLRVNAEGFAKFKEKITQNPQSDKPFKPFKPSNYSTYRGISKGIKGIKNLADHLNCSVFISHLPEKVYYHEIFSIINTGSVISAYIDDPIYGCPFSTAKITFKYPEGAARFIEQANSAEGIKIREHYLSVLYNAHGMVKYPIEHQSRVLYIEGPIHKMSGMFWKSYFIKITRFNLEYVGYLPLAQPHQFRRMMEFRFVRIGAQAERFFTAIIEDPQFYCPKYGRDVTVKYGEDPCGRGWDVLPRTKTI
ncbi:hypothetical protein OCU04_006567 [Sclerotinia nivalis]|uniref:RRM domain-containing protein n=1 Tax=Sclerotinia nivalis TaxID=352851 RepID=A0A9X0DIJ3_9HELO|nr:hypothetical protein OCU04_006567 [Sclerotinia nivalis]